ncbi:protein adenylyltransferase SelO-like [Esox lucius]|uniref:protein adenylyltransferase SelO-like n=1 Tax=Esox lucius TaxID=8010 RepID=UPI001477476B|nr:protein adenylyltransferase SelO-like [Esox lucius]
MMSIHNASSFVFLCLANLIVVSAGMDSCESVDEFHSHGTVSDRQRYTHVFKSNLNMSGEKHLLDLDLFKVSCRKLIEAFPLDQVSGNFVRSVKNCIFSVSDPTPLRGPLMLGAVSKEVIEGLLDLDIAFSQSEDFLQYFSGGRLFPGSIPLTHRYGGHQFGYWAGQLGDGRAHLLGEYTSREGERWELQLKGSGRTPYSRSGDGRAVLRSSVREFLCSEAMHFLGVPTSRAASLIVSEEPVWRDQFYNGTVKKERGKAFVLFLRGHFRHPSLSQHQVHTAHISSSSAYPPSGRGGSSSRRGPQTSVQLFCGWPSPGSGSDRWRFWLKLESRIF